MTTRLPVVLEDLRIASPCNADWDEMSGTDRVRFCGKCEKNVYNLSAMTRDEAESLVREKEARMCVRLYQRQDGTVITQDCPVGVQKKRLRQRVWASLSGAAASVALVFGLFGGRARGDLTLKDGKKHPVVQAPIAMGGAVAVMEMGKPAPEVGKIEMKGKVEVKGKPVKGQVEVVKKPPKPEMAKMGEPMPMRMGDVSPEK